MSTPTEPWRAWPNRFRERLLAREALIGCWCSLAHPITAEVLGLAGFDWILLDGEHAPNDIGSLVLQLMALKDSVSAPVVRPSWNDTVEIKRLLDAGFHNLLIPFVESADDARRAVRATRYPPEGVRGVSVAQRFNRYGSVPEPLHGANAQVALVLQIESPAGVRAAREIAAIDGVDGLFVGPSDLAAGFGLLGRPAEPVVQQAIAEVFAAAAAAGKASGILAPVEADARRYLQMGASFVAVGSDLGAFRAATQGLRDRYRDIGAAAQGTAAP